MTDGLRGRTRRAIDALVAGLVFVPAILLSESPGRTWGLELALLPVVAAAGLLVARFVGRPSRISLVLSMVAVITGTALMASASTPLLRALAALLIGYGAGGLLERPFAWKWMAAAPVLPLGLSAAVYAGGIRAGLVLVAVVVFTAISTTSMDQLHIHHRARALPGLWDTALAVQAAAIVLYVGAVSPAAGWFGSLESHGPRSGDLVAITFDDGPNGETTLRLADILEQHNARGTFFEVGNAVALEPDVSRALVERGHLVGNHSQSHARFSYLVPGYPEFDRAEATLKRVIGVCPAFFRPPHGSHTPFVSRAVNDGGATVVTWDVEADDWKAREPADIAADIVSQSRGGSIILLHDGLDGVPGADRSRLVEALPLILDGLERKHLRPVLLSELLGQAGYLSDC